MPLCAQIIGARLEDHTTLSFAQLIELSWVAVAPNRVAWAAPGLIDLLRIGTITSRPSREGA